MEPTVGRIVHYAAEGGAHHAAVVTAVQDEDGDDAMVSLTVFPPGAAPYPVGPGVRGGGLEGQWHWPERSDW